MKHILFVVTNASEIGTKKIKTGYEFSEIADPYLEFLKVGYTVDFASLLGGIVPEDGFEENHTNSVLFRNSNGFKRLNFSHQLENINTDAYDAIFFPGGLGPMVDLFDNHLVKNTISKMYENNKIIAAVCHGTVVFLNVQLSNSDWLLKDKKVTSFTIEEEEHKNHKIGEIIPFILENELKNQGAIFKKSEPFNSNVIIDGNLITGQNPLSAVGVAKAIIQKLN